MSVANVIYDSESDDSEWDRIFEESSRVKAREMAVETYFKMLKEKNSETCQEQKIDMRLLALTNAIIQQHRRKYVMIAKRVKTSLHDLINKEYEGSDNDYLIFCNDLKEVYDNVDEQLNYLDEINYW
jgi:hypothetical protein